MPKYRIGLILSYFSIFSPLSFLRASSAFLNLKISLAYSFNLVSICFAPGYSLTALCSIRRSSTIFNKLYFGSCLASLIILKSLSRQCLPSCSIPPSIALSNLSSIPFGMLGILMDLPVVEKRVPL